jgi:hypothetical protein
MTPARRIRPTFALLLTAVVLAPVGACSGGSQDRDEGQGLPDGAAEGGQPARDGASPGCQPTTCSAKGARCGPLSDGCGGMLSCGTCPAPDACNAGACVCTPATCASLAANCGTLPDGCGGSLSCGTCSGSQTCGGGGSDVCGTGTCQPTTCEAEGANCGAISDGCGHTLQCGSCQGSAVCGGSGKANVCGCTPTTCADQGASCGSISDGCGGTLSCGSCASPETCGGSGTANVCGTPGGGDASSVPTGLCTTSTQGSYALPTDRGTAWNLAGMLTKGGVPSASWPVCNATPLAPSGGSDDSAAINALIESCAPGTVVQLAAGTFLMGQGLYVAVDKGVVLRGAGAGVTILKNPLNTPATPSNQNPTDTTPVVIVGPGRWVNPDGDARCQGLTAYQTAYMQLLAADGTKGSTSVTVPDGSIFQAGQFVLLDETSGASWQPDVAGIATSVWASPDYAVTWQLHNPGSTIDDPIEASVTPSASDNYAGSGTGSDAACWFCRQDRPQNEIKEVASVSGGTVTFTSPLHKDYHVSQHAELTTYTGGNAQLTGAGIEKLTAIGGGDGGIRFENTAYSWAKNIEVTVWYGEGVALDGSFRVELRDSYIHDAAWAEPGGAGYAISLASGTSEVLVENNISIRANKVMVARSSGAGSVVGYNYMDDGYIATTEVWIEIGLNASHMVGSHHVLFEGNESFNIDSDDTHGNSTYHTYFRNWTTSVRTTFQSDYTGDTIDDTTTAGNGPKRAAGAMGYTYFMSFVGNVLGMPGVTTTANGYVDETTDWVNQGDAIWMLGWNDVSPYTLDTTVASTAVRDGNWDVLLGAQTWLTSTAASLPSSCYLTSAPAFFGSTPWPWVDPTTGAVGTLPAKARYAAGTPNSP